MAGRWRDPAAFRADPSAAPAVRPSRRQALALLTVLLLVAGTTTLVSYLVRPDRARAFDLLHGSLYLQDSSAPVAVDLATGRPTVRLLNAQRLVGLTNPPDVEVVPLTDGTLLLDPATGTFNVVDSTGFVIKSNGGGVPLPEKAPSLAVANGSSAYIVQGGDASSVYLVDGPTVTRATGSTKAAQPRASIAMPDASSSVTDPAAFATADGDLWMLVDVARNRTVRRLAVPPNSSQGATLTATDRGTASRVAAIGTTQTSRGTYVGVASDNGVRIFLGARDVAEVRFPRLRDVTEIMPVSNAAGRLSYLMRDGSSWKLVSVDADGSSLHAPSTLDLPVGAPMVPPAESDGRLFTMNTATRQLLTIDRAGRVRPLEAIPTYPAAPDPHTGIDVGPFTDASVVARHSRVFFDSPSHVRAVVVFTDSDRTPFSIRKRSAVVVDLAGGAEALARVRSGTKLPAKNNPTPPRTRPGTTPRPTLPPPATPRLNCNNVRQKPHTPTVVDAQAGSRSVLVQWTYVTSDNADCDPSTYLVTVTLDDRSAPPAPQAVRVQGNTRVNLVGLFPSTTYTVTVQAFINGFAGDAAKPLSFTTGPEGPPAPANVLASTDSTGTWNVTWSSCGSTRTGCVTAASWKVIPEFCDGRGLSNPPAAFSVPGDPTSVDQPSGVLAGGDALLGRGLRFQVEGIGEVGTVGRPSGYTACTYSWTPPVAADIKISASTPPTTTGQDATRTTVSTRLLRGPVHDLGGVGGSLTYELLDSSGTVVDSNGPTSSLSATLVGVRAGARFSVVVVATPPRHAEADVTVGPVPVREAIAVFPAPTVTAQVRNTSFFEGALDVSFSLPSGTDTHGETFDLVNSSFTCGAHQRALTFSGVSPGQTMTFDNPPVNRFDTVGTSCSVTLQLVQNRTTLTDPPLYGAATSRADSTPVPVSPPSVTASDSDFHAQWTGSLGRPQVLVTYNGSDQLLFASNWTISVVLTNPNGTVTCGSTNSPPSTTVDVTKNCVRAGGTFTVSIAYHYLLSDPRFTVAVTGAAPQPVDPNKVDYSAVWNTDVTNPLVLLHYTGREDTSSFGTFTWSETVTSDLAPGVICGSSSAPASGDVAVGVDLTKCLAMSADGTTAAKYSIEVKFHDDNYGIDFDKTYLVDGTPPS